MKTYKISYLPSTTAELSEIIITLSSDIGTIEYTESGCSISIADGSKLTIPGTITSYHEINLEGKVICEENTGEYDTLLDDRYRVVVPIDLRRIMNVGKGDKVSWVLRDNKIYIEKVIEGKNIPLTDKDTQGLRLINSITNTLKRELEIAQ